MTASNGYKCRLELDGRAAQHLGSNFSWPDRGQPPPTVSVFRSGQGNQPEENWIAEIYLASSPSADEIRDMKSLLERGMGIKLPDLEFSEIPDRNWILESQKLLGPVTAGRFFIHGAHIDAPGDKDRIPIMLEAGQAFGSGHHASTQGCLAMLDVLKRRVTPVRILDLGSGSAILAIAAAKLWPARITAIDIDPIATRVGRANALKNEVVVRNLGDQIPGILFTTADGIPPVVASGEGPFDLITANILADPLVALAPVVAKSTTDMGCVLISGLLDSQKDTTVAAYAEVGLQLLEAMALGEWVTLLFMKGGADGAGM